MKFKYFAETDSLYIKVDLKELVLDKLRAAVKTIAA
jgi:uncharacterized protein YuzE